MKKALMLFFAVVYMLSFVGCMTVHLTSEGVEQPVSMTNNVNKNFIIVKHFSRELKGWFTFFNLVTVQSPKVAEVIRSELIAAKGDAVINIKIKGQFTFIDGLIPAAAATLGSLIAPPWGGLLGYLIGLRTYTVEGDVIRYY
jgi:hypothetical protein